MLVSIVCSKCGTEGKFSISQPVYQGPYKCWKCKEMFTIKMEHTKLISLTPMNPDELDRFERDQAAKNRPQF